MYEKVNPCHPDKVADRIAGAVVDLAYAGVDGGLVSGFPKVAVEVLLGHGRCYVIIETGLSRQELREREVVDAVYRIAGKDIYPDVLIVGQDEYLAANQSGAVRCGDNGIFRGFPIDKEKVMLTAIANDLYERYKTDGKYILNGSDAIICQSNMQPFQAKELAFDLEAESLRGNINPLGFWTGGSDVDSGATNRKLGSDMGDAVTGGGLHGKDLSKADVSVNIVCHIKAAKSGGRVEACCAIGDEQVDFVYVDGRHELMAYADVVEQARLYILTDCDGSFEKFAEWGLIRP